MGTPGSGKTFSIIEPFIRQHSEKGFAVVLYDYKFPTLATKLYYHYLKNKNAKDSKMPKGMKFNMINVRRRGVFKKSEPYPVEVYQQFGSSK